MGACVAWSILSVGVVRGNEGAGSLSSTGTMRRVRIGLWRGIS